MSEYSDWIGRQTQRVETINERQVAHLRATLAGTPVANCRR